jgi:hypothetical protein
MAASAGPKQARLWDVGQIAFWAARQPASPVALSA